MFVVKKVFCLLSAFLIAFISIFAFGTSNKVYADSDTATVGYSFSGRNLYDFYTTNMFKQENGVNSLYGDYSHGYMFSVDFHTFGRKFYLDNIYMYEMSIGSLNTNLGAYNLDYNFCDTLYLATSDTKSSSSNYTTYLVGQDRDTDLSLELPQGFMFTFNSEPWYESNFNPGSYEFFSKHCLMYCYYNFVDDTTDFGEIIGVNLFSRGFGVFSVPSYVPKPTYKWGNPGYSSVNYKRFSWNVGDSTVRFFNIQYFDIYGNTITFGTWVPDIYTRFEDRTYYFNRNVSSDTFQTGYNSGFYAGLSSRQEEIFDNGYNSGYNVGYNFGYTVGLSEDNPYTFLNLIGAVVDAPVSALTNLLNFEILGVNLSSFFFGLLTLVVILFVLRKILGG